MPVRDFFTDATVIIVVMVVAAVAIAIVLRLNSPLDAVGLVDVTLENRWLFQILSLWRLVRVDDGRMGRNIWMRLFGWDCLRSSLWLVTPNNRAGIFHALSDLPSVVVYITMLFVTRIDRHHDDEDDDDGQRWSGQTEAVDGGGCGMEIE